MISQKDVQYIASLARIYLDDGELTHLTKDLEGILYYVAKLEKLDVSQVKPTSHVLPLKNVYREDKIKPSLPQKTALGFAVSQHNGFFKVPKVLE